MAKLLEEPLPLSVPLQSVGNNDLCFSNVPVTLEELSKKRLALFTVTYKTPRSLENSMKTWEEKGLLDLFDERVLWINAPMPEDFELGKRFGFKTVQPSDYADYVFKSPMPDIFKPPTYAPGEPQHLKHVHGMNENSLRVGPTLAYGLDDMDADYVLFLEKDFKISPSATREDVRAEILNAVFFMSRGVSIYRLRSRIDTGTAGFPNCCTRSCSAVFSPNHGNSWSRQRNWFHYYCNTLPKAAVHAKLVDECSPKDSPVQTRCFTAFDSNWSNNPFFVDREWFFTGMGPRHSVAVIGLSGEPQKDNGMFEITMLDINWGQYHSPMCISYHGIFLHEEIDGRR